MRLIILYFAAIAALYIALPLALGANAANGSKATDPAVANLSSEHVSSLPTELTREPADGTLGVEQFSI